MTETPAASTGWVLVPREPCPEQIKGIEFAIYRYSDCSARDAERGAPHAYRAMIAAAPARVLSEEDLERAKSDVCEVAKDLVALWHSPKIEGLARAERNAAISETRDRLIKAVQRLAGKTPTMAERAALSALSATIEGE